MNVIVNTVVLVVNAGSVEFPTATVGALLYAMGNVIDWFVVVSFS